MMYIELESLGQVLRVEGSSLYISNEKDEGVYVDDIRELEGTVIYKRIVELEKELRGAVTELKDIAIDKVKRNELKGVVDEAREVA